MAFEAFRLERDDTRMPVDAIGHPFVRGLAGFQCGGGRAFEIVAGLVVDVHWFGIDDEPTEFDVFAFLDGLKDAAERDGRNRETFVLAVEVVMHDLESGVESLVKELCAAAGFLDGGKCSRGWGACRRRDVLRFRRLSVAGDCEGECDCGGEGASPLREARSAGESMIHRRIILV